MKIALIGYGKMGHLIHEIAQERGHQVVCIVDPYLEESLLNDELNRLRLNDELKVRVIGFDSDEFRSADVAIEFTTPTTAADNIRQAWEQGVPVVSGTTGWNIEKEIGNRIQAIGERLEDASLQVRGERLEDASLQVRGERLEDASLQVRGERIQVVDEKGKVWLIWKSNFSVGVNVFFELNKVLAQALAQYKQYTPSITETHHIHKLDKPSGTAVTLREGIVDSLKWKVESLKKPSSLEVESLEVPIESIREGEVAGIHTVTWDSEEDTITITHSAKSRRGFALGAVLAAEQLL